MNFLSGKFHECHGNCNDLSQQGLASQAEPSQAKPSLLTTAYLFFICQENFMKNLLGKFHAELSQQRLASQAKPSLLTTTIFS